MLHEETTRAILGAAIEVHRHLGPGLLESTYRRCLIHELTLRELPVSSEVDLDLDYKGLHLKSAYRLDLLVADAVIIEIKAVESLSSIHRAQLVTYLRLAKRRVGLLLNFNVERLTRDGLVRVVL